jgi:ABC-2 type transport system ATP-binding protein
MQVGEIGWFTSSFYESGFLDRYREGIARYGVPEDRKIRHLSKGQRAKVALALAVAHDPELLILDEPTSGLDPLVRREFLESMLDRVATGRTVLLSSHQIAEVERVADSVAILHAGKFQIVESLSSLRDSVTEVTVSLDDPLVQLPLPAAPAVVMSDRAEGRQRQMVMRSFNNQAADQWRGRPGVAGVTVRSATLDEVFAACVRGNGNAEQSNRSIS